MTDKGLFSDVVWEWQVHFEDRLRAFYRKFSKANGPTMIVGSLLAFGGLALTSAGSVILGSTLLLFALYVFVIDAFQRQRKNHPKRDPMDELRMSGWK